MSALAKVYASRGLNLSVEAALEKSNPTPTVSLDPGAPVVLRRRTEEGKPAASEAISIADQNSKAKISGIQDYTAALGMLENVNSGFADVFSRLQKSEAMKDQLIAECEKQDGIIQQYQSELENARHQYDETESQNAEITQRLIAETSRASNLEHRAKQAEFALSEAQRRIEEVEMICKTLHDGIYQVFGVGSPVQKVLNSLAKS